MLVYCIMQMKILRYNVNFRIEQDNDHSRLTINQAQRQLTGTFTCAVQNGVQPPSETNLTLDVYCELFRAV